MQVQQFLNDQYLQSSFDFRLRILIAKQTPNRPAYWTSGSSAATGLSANVMEQEAAGEWLHGGPGCPGPLFALLKSRRICVKIKANQKAEVKVGGRFDRNRATEAPERFTPAAQITSDR